MGIITNMLFLNLMIRLPVLTRIYIFLLNIKRRRGDHEVLVSDSENSSTNDSSKSFSSTSSSRGTSPAPMNSSNQNLNNNNNMSSSHYSNGIEELPSYQNSMTKTKIV